ncbi:MAG: hypothetical protein N4A54_04160 [Peptostreptococcaceae bacterium]|jgi:hypothetical protein|nr:hypothetical protein [Peptostreptococcaceae bacterium]
MKRIFKILSIMVTINFVLGFTFIGWLGFTLVAPSLKDTGITAKDLFRKDIDPQKIEKFEQNISSQSSQLGKSAANTVIKGVEKLFPSPDFDYSNFPAAEYPYPSIDEVLEMQNQKVEEGIAEGLKNLEDMEAHNKIVRKKALADYQY